MSDDGESDHGTRTDAYTFADVSVVMGTYNEREAIGAVLEDIERVTDGQAEVVCVDSSSDGTAEVAREHGARVIEQEPQGYGVAVHEAIATPDRPVIVTTDCDDTYPMERLPDFLAAINDGYDVVSGDRLTGGAETMPRFNRLGNHAFAWLASALIGERVHDTTTGMRAYRHEVIDAIEWTENTGLSAELLLRPLVRGYRVTEIPIDYRERVGETTLDPLAGGAAIAKSIAKVSLQERWQSRSGSEPAGLDRTVDGQSR
ncbi:Galactosyltransferase protein [Halorhabdus tiamatea SARL4B]|uniref:Galactosyltransferase protein n=1 Tax=Halorhabdus tiamatea SARL4B TaxID=1033806 RepID=F7PFB8_9EURY|nr:dolichyl-phosphate hexose transferase [Halorhabdus tiamatea]ERJ05748.1 Galactosyltransferase protein [Halorhabdus tiamatea SARL4B]CCQ33928.1 glycosyltransferase [Halorhabdus tiamatea SARL4B]